MHRGARETERNGDAGVLGVAVHAEHPAVETVERSVREDGFQCRQCGHCCINVSGAFSACATEADLERWEAAGRDDILAWVEPIAVGDERVYDLTS
jgi:uncharacterized OB-fold protein